MGYANLQNTLKASTLTVPAARAFDGEPIRHGENSWYEALADLEL